MEVTATETKILAAALQVANSALNDLVGECLEEGKSKAPSMRAIMKARGMLPPSFEHTLNSKPAKGKQ